MQRTKKGGRKAELVARVEGLLKLNLPIDLKIDDGLWHNQKEQKNSHVMQDFIDISIPGDGWRDFPTRNLPQNFNCGNISQLLLAENGTFQQKSMTQYRKTFTTQPKHMVFC